MRWRRKELVREIAFCCVPPKSIEGLDIIEAFRTIRKGGGSRREARRASHAVLNSLQIWFPSGVTALEHFRQVIIQTHSDSEAVAGFLMLD